ncbi:MAG: hypothetical protein WC959_04670 [Kiritimatiellales bacterium]
MKKRMMIALLCSIGTAQADVLLKWGSDTPYSNFIFKINGQTYSPAALGGLEQLELICYSELSLNWSTNIVSVFLGEVLAGNVSWAAADNAVYIKRWDEDYPYGVSADEEGVCPGDDPLAITFDTGQHCWNIFSVDLFRG